MNIVANLFNNSDAATVKEGLSSKGYRVDYANAKPSKSEGGNGVGFNGRRQEFRSTQNLNVGIVGSENGNGEDNGTVDNR